MEVFNEGVGSKLVSIVFFFWILMSKREDLGARLHKVRNRQKKVGIMHVLK